MRARCRAELDDYGHDHVSHFLVLKDAEGQLVRLVVCHESKPTAITSGWQGTMAQLQSTPWLMGRP